VASRFSNNFLMPSHIAILGYLGTSSLMSILQEGGSMLPVDEKGNIVPSDVDYVDTWKAMEECVKLGLTKSIGVSNFNSEQIQRVLDVATIRPAVNQVNT